MTQLHRPRLERLVADAVRLTATAAAGRRGEMLERAAGWPTSTACRAVELGTPDEFFDHVEAEVAAGAPVPVWRGELYFETHRGTLTRQLATKVGNRRCERLLREAELWCGCRWRAPRRSRMSSSAVAGRADAAVPRHPPGLVDRLGARRRRGCTALEVAERLEVRSSPTHSIDRRSCDVLDRQRGDTRPREVIVVDGEPTMVEVPGSGIAELVRRRPVDDRVVCTEQSMTNRLVAVRWDLDGKIISIIDLVRARELLPAGKRSARTRARPSRVGTTRGISSRGHGRLGSPHLVGGFGRPGRASHR